MRSRILAILSLRGSERSAFVGLALALVTATSGALRPDVGAQEPVPTVDGERLVRDLAALAHDSMEGRRTGTAGSARARRFLVGELEAEGVPPPTTGRIQEFDLRRLGGSPGVTGTNVLGLVAGTEFPARYIVVSAHYDHLGIQGGQIYNGADDNASGSAALLVLARYFAEHRPRHSLLFVWFDAEELVSGGRGSLGARAFLADAIVPMDSILLNVNLDMVSRSSRGELYAAGTYHYRFLAPLVEEVARRSAVSLLTGHDTPGLPLGDDWTELSDHGPFHEAGVPFLYFGVEDHPGYHRPSDTFENVTLEFYVDAVTTIADFVRVADREVEVLR